MCNVTKNITFQNRDVSSLVHKILYGRLFILFIFHPFFMLQYSSIGHAMQQSEDSVELQSAIRIVAQNKGNGLSTTLYDEETPLLTAIREKPTPWKQNWFVKNVIVEFPIIGDFFHDDPSILDSIKRAGKTTSMLVGGSVGMMLDFIPMTGNDNMALKITKNSLNMAIGMWVATSAYNTVLSLGYIGYNCIKGE